MDLVKLCTIIFLSLFITSISFGQIEINKDKISNLETTGGGIFTTFGNIDYDSYGHNFLHNGTEIMNINEFGIDVQSSSRITRQQTGGLKVDLLPFAYGRITHNSNTGISNDTGNFTATGDDNGNITLTFSDATVITSNLVVIATPIVGGIVAATQVSLAPTMTNHMTITLYSPSGGGVSTYGANILVYRP